MKANEKGVLYEKIDPTHIANQIKSTYGIEVEEHFFKMKKKITQTGEYNIPFQYNTIEKDMQIIIKAEDAKKSKEETEEAVAA
jgi:ribosomal protein L9